MHLYMLFDTKLLNHTKCIYCFVIAIKESEKISCNNSIVNGFSRWTSDVMVFVQKEYFKAIYKVLLSTLFAEIIFACLEGTMKSSTTENKRKQIMSIWTVYWTCTTFLFVVIASINIPTSTTYYRENDNELSC